MTERKHIEIAVTLAASPQDVFRALTEADQLTQWFAEGAAVDPAAKQYDFWGRFTPQAPERSQGQHQLLAYEPARALAFTWTLHGLQTSVDIRLAPAGEGALLTLKHEGVRVLQEGDYALSDFWSLSLENLRGWVERRQVGARCNFAAAPQGTVRLGIDIDAPAAAVFAALVEPAELERYIARGATIEPEAGGVYDIGWGEEGPLKILEISPPAKLAYSWQSPKQAETGTVVTWTLAESGGGTHLTLVHSGFAPDRAGADYQAGWLNFLNRIKFMVEGGAAWERPQVIGADY